MRIKRDRLVRKGKKQNSWLSLTYMHIYIYRERESRMINKGEFTVEETLFAYTHTHTL